MKRFVFVFGFLFFALLASVGMSLFWTQKIPPKKPVHSLVSQERSEAEELTQARELLRDGVLKSVFSLIDRYEEAIRSNPQAHEEWLHLSIDACLAERNQQKLLQLLELYPTLFTKHEEASLFLADWCLAQGMAHHFHTIDKLWRPQITKAETWIVLEADCLLLEGNEKEAIQLLKSKKLEEREEVGRLVRLALLHFNEKPKMAWSYLSEAYRLDPKNPDIHSYRAHLLESVGKNNLAHSEYQEASNLAPDNLHLKGELADFYLRHKHYPAAMQIWQEQLDSGEMATKEPTLEEAFWLRVFFCSRITLPLETPPLLPEKTPPFLSYLATLPSDQFWNEDHFKELPEASKLLTTYQETFWLRLLSLLQKGEELEAQQLLQYNPFCSASWYPELSTALQRLLNYRLDHTLQISQESSVKTPLPSLFAELEKLASHPDQHISVELDELLHSPEAFSALFLAAGWNEAGLTLHTLETIPSTFPEWVSYHLALALKTNRSQEKLSTFIQKQPKTPWLLLLEGEIAHENGHFNTALEKLKPLLTLDNDLGDHAAWLTSLTLIEKKEYDKAQEILEKRKRLKETMMGQETLARVALLQGHIQQAEKIYGSILNQSAEAKSYFAKKSFNAKEWSYAKKLTESLLESYPDNVQLQENLKKIEEKKNH